MNESWKLPDFEFEDDDDNGVPSPVFRTQALQTEAPDQTDGYPVEEESEPDSVEEYEVLNGETRIEPPGFGRVPNREEFLSQDDVLQVIH